MTFRRPPSGFTLLELLVVVSIIGILLVAIVPAFNTIKRAGDITSAAYTVKDTLEQARTYAMANNTYVWIGFFEEDVSTASTNPATAGTGRIVLSAVSSKDGTSVYDPNALAAIDPTKIAQIGKLVKIEGAHLTTFPDGTGVGESFDARPPAVYNTARIGDSTPPNPSLTPFQYPTGNPAPTAQYTFTKAVEFNPRGEARIDNSNYTLKAVAEIGLRPTHGTSVDTNTPNVAAIQFSGVAGNFKVYRR
jgi:prepilin-type N-terminal cleavage/methylation domain-containing protein